MCTPADKILATPMDKPQLNCMFSRWNLWESVKAVLMELGRLNIKRLIMSRETQFYRHSFLAYDSFLRDVLCVFIT